MTISSEIGRLREKFLAKMAERIESMRASVGALADDRLDREALRNLSTLFHNVAGSGAIYGYPEASRVARLGDDETYLLLKRGEPPTDSNIACWAELVNEIDESLEGPAQSVDFEVSPAFSIAFDVLIVEDDPEFVAKAREHLDRDGFTVRVASNATQAIGAMETRLPDAVIVENRLSEGSGFEVIEAMRRMPQGEKPTAIVVSLVTGFLDKVEAIRSGADAFFEKPIDFPALLRRLEIARERKRVTRSRVLSVEDDPVQAEFIRHVLESAGYEVYVCGDPDDFERELALVNPDLVLMDLVLSSHVNGIDLVRYIRQNERYAALPVIFLTTERELQTTIDMISAGGDEHLSKPVSSALLVSSVAARIERARFLKSLLQNDGLTGLLTHAAFNQRGLALMAERKREPDLQAALVMMDLDNFKNVNDTWGHPVGDRVLASFGGMLRRRLRQSDCVARYGGEEFAVLFRNLTSEEAVRLMERLLEEFASIEHSASGTTFRVTFSAGISVLDESIDSWETWKTKADHALYESKRAGRNRVTAV